MQDVDRERLPEMAVERRCTVVIPCYNEAARLRPEQFAQFLAQDPEIQFLLVNDGSRDETLALLQALAAGHPGRVRVLDLQPNRGKAEAVRAGMLAAIAQGDCAFTGFWDADLATPLDTIPLLLDALVTRPWIEMVFGARVRLLGREIHRLPVRHYLGRCFATVVSMTLQLPIYDTQCGAKLFRITPELGEMLAAPFLSRWIFDVELIARFLALHRGDRGYAEHAIYEYPLPCWLDVAGSKVKAGDFFKAFFELIRIRQVYLR